MQSRNAIPCVSTLHIYLFNIFCMKKTLLFLLLIISGHVALAQNCDVNFLGTKTLYKSAIQKYKPAPAGYLPVFINHVGRHGARHLTKDVKTTLAYTLLLQADSTNNLTTAGKKLKQMMIALQKIEKGSTKFISAEGRDELKGLGERMYLNYNNVFKDKSNLSVAVTKEVRTKQSADAFLQGLSSKLKDTAATKFYNDDTGLRFYDLSPAYKSFEDGVDGNAVMLSLQKEIHFAEMNKTIIGRFFTADFLEKLKLKDKQEAKFTADIFGFATIVYSLSEEIRQAGYQFADLDFKSFFTCVELQKLGELDSIDENLKKGAGTDNDGIQVRVAVPLLVDFIKTTDDFIKTGKNNANLRFAHAETIAPFAALLQISNADKATKVISKLNSSWQSSGIIPLGANIQWIFYKGKGSAGYLMKILLNEKEVLIDGIINASPYYKWSEVRGFYMRKLDKLGVKLTDDMGAYLTSVK
jgi:multiple inositol-polyphosphate phosphatase/2,3-bisphosphoglycerate 3-phosphatase